MKNKCCKVTLILCILTFLVFILSVFFHFSIPTDEMKGGATTDHLSKGDIIKQNYNFDHLDVRSLIFRIATYGNTVKYLDLTAILYDSNNNEISKRDYVYSDMHDGLFLELPVDHIDMHGLYHIEFKINDLSKDDVFVLYKTNDISDINSYNYNGKDIEGNIAFTISGYKPSYFWSNIILIVFTIELLILFLSLKHYELSKKKDKILFFALYIVSSVLLVLSLLYVNLHVDITSLRDISYILLSISITYVLWYLCNYLKDNNKLIEKIFVLLVIPLGLMSVIYLIPCETFDIHAHYGSAYHVLVDGNHQDKLYVPKVVSEKGYYRVNNYAEFHSLINEEYNYNDLGYIKEQENSTPYNFMNYLPSIVGIFVGKILNLSPFLGMYIAKLFNLLFFIILGYFIIKNIPVGKTLMLVFMMGPLFIQQATSINADGIINIASLFFISYLLKIKYDNKNKMRIRDIIILAISLLFISIQKINYIVLGLLVFMLFDKIKKMGKKEWIAACISAISVIALCLLWYYVGGNSATGEVLDGVLTNAAYSSRDIKQLFYVLTLSFKNLYGSWMASSFGRALGWEHIGINPFAYVLYIAMIVLSLFTKDNDKESIKYNKIDKILTISAYVIGACLIIYGLYSSWTYIGIMQVNGVQGRYFIPLNIILLVMINICNSKKLMSKDLLSIVSISLIIVNIYSMINVLQFY